jgi:hypothetical protein
MLTTDSMKPAAGQVYVKITRATILTGVGKVKVGDVHQCSSADAHTLIAQGQAVPSEAQTREPMNKPAPTKSVAAKRTKGK